MAGSGYSGRQGKHDPPSGSHYEYPRRIGTAQMAAALSKALSAGVLGNDDNAVVFYDSAHLDSTLNALKSAFPRDALHAVAVKANPLVAVLKRVQRAGCGAEVASMGELKVAEAAGFPIERIVFDSPVKTHEDLEYALTQGIWVNANSLEELERIAAIHTSLRSQSRVGIRINPEVGQGRIATTSVADRHSKFGVPLRDCRPQITAAFARYPWLKGLHVHIGSQGMSLDELLEGVGLVYDFCVASRDKSNIGVLNIGGGLPVQYRDSDPAIPFSQYANALRARCPELFSGSITVVTEFGRAVHAHCGWVVARVEYVVRNSPSISTIYLHVGADMFLRKAYRPEDWHHNLTICDDSGAVRTGATSAFQVAGPLCFAGDYLSRDAALPSDTIAGDYCLIHDAGAYTFSMWSHYNSRQFPAVIGYEGEPGHFQIMRRRQSTDDVVAFWS